MIFQHLEEEGHDPATFKFDFATVETKTPAKRTRRSESTAEHEEDTPAMEDMIVQDDAGEEEESEHTEKKDKVTVKTPAEVNMDVDETEKVNRKREMKDDTEAVEPKKTCLEKETGNEDEPKIENNIDAEDSINLDIGDDELLNEEVRFYFFSVTVKLPTGKSKVTNGFVMEVDQRA